MKFEHDKVTGELVDPLPPPPPPKRGRGRPKGDTAPKSPADRQKARRERLAASGAGFLTVELPADLLAALDKFAAFKSETKNEIVQRILRDRLTRKR